MGAFAKVAGARPTEGGRYFAPGEYVVRLQAIKHIQTRMQKDAFVVETRIVESNVDKLPAKSECSWMVTMDKDAAPGNIVGFVVAATGCTPEEVDEAGVLALVGKDQPLAGHFMRISAFNKPTRDGKPFTRVKWQMLTPEELKQYSLKAGELGL